MDEQEALAVFERHLSSLTDKWEDIDSMRWFCDDFDRYCPAFVQAITDKIRRAMDHQAVHYYYLIDRISRTCDNVYLTCFSERLPELLHGSVTRNDVNVLRAARQIIDRWAAENIYPPEAIRMMRSAMTVDQMVQQPQAPPPTLFSMPRVSPVPVYEMAPAPVVPEAPKEEEKVEEKRLARAWMRAAHQWEDPEGAQMLVVDVDAEDVQAPVDQEVFWIIIDATNTGVKCKSCGGPIAIGKAPNGAPAYIDVVRTPAGYYHTECHKLDDARKPKRSIFD